MSSVLVVRLARIAKNLSELQYAAWCFSQVFSSHAALMVHDTLEKYIMHYHPADIANVIIAAQLLSTRRNSYDIDFAVAISDKFRELIGRATCKAVIVEQ
mgnify:CR=1 FL=1